MNTEMEQALAMLERAMSKELQDSIHEDKSIKEIQNSINEKAEIVSKPVSYTHLRAHET